MSTTSKQTDNAAAAEPLDESELSQVVGGEDDGPQTKSEGPAPLSDPGATNSPWDVPPPPTP